MSVYILSTMTGGVAYTFYDGVKDLKSGALPIARRSIHIAGGKGLPSLNHGIGEQHKDEQGHIMWTPSGVVTTLTDEQFSVLKDHAMFKKHLDAGYLKVVNSDISTNHNAIDKISQHMEQRDAAAQLTPDTLKKKIMGLTPSVRTGDSDDTWDGRSPVRVK